VNIAVDADIYAFTLILSGVNKVQGNVGIGCTFSSGCQGSPITEAQLLTVFGNLKQITGNLDIVSNTNLGSIEGLRNLTSVGGYLNISGNPNLSNVEGLRSLTDIGGFMSIGKNAKLNSVVGLRNLQSIRNSANFAYAMSFASTPLGYRFPLSHARPGQSISTTSILTSLISSLY
jgi:hypothetical protein